MLMSGVVSGTTVESAEPCTVEARLQSKLAAAAHISNMKLRNKRGCISRITPD